MELTVPYHLSNNSGTTSNGKVVMVVVAVATVVVVVAFEASREDMQLTRVPKCDRTL